MRMAPSVFDVTKSVGVLDVTVSETLADPDLVGSAMLVAVTVTVCTLLIVAGAVYRPDDETLPTLGLIDHVTDVFEAFCTVEVNGCVCPW